MLNIIAMIAFTFFLQYSLHGVFYTSSGHYVHSVYLHISHNYLDKVLIKCK